MPKAATAENVIALEGPAEPSKLLVLLGTPGDDSQPAFYASASDRYRRVRLLPLPLVCDSRAVSARFRQCGRGIPTCADA